MLARFDACRPVKRGLSLGRVRSPLRMATSLSGGLSSSDASVCLDGSGARWMFVLLAKNKMTERLTDLPQIDLSQINSILASGKDVTIQYSKKCYSNALLRQIDSICLTHGERIEVRFYGHYSESFDAACLANIPNVEWLSIDCLQRISAIDHLYELRNLKRLSIGVYELEVPEILSKVRIKDLNQLSIGDAKSCKIDLSPLAQCSELRKLHISSQSTGFNVLSSLPELSDLRLISIKKKQSLAVVSLIPKLSKLFLLLGGRENIDEISHSGLRDLSIVRVLGFSSIGDLSRFPMLERLLIEDQLKLEFVDLRNASSSLRHLFLLNCKSLRKIGSIGHLAELEELRVYKTNIELDDILAEPRPSSLSIFALYTGKTKADKTVRSRLDSLGYSEFRKK